jgi:hypothetical protein
MRIDAYRVLTRLVLPTTRRAPAVRANFLAGGMLALGLAMGCELDAKPQGNAALAVEHAGPSGGSAAADSGEGRDRAAEPMAAGDTAGDAARAHTKPVVGSKVPGMPASTPSAGASGSSGTAPPAAGHGGAADLQPSAAGDGARSGAGGSQPTAAGNAANGGAGDANAGTGASGNAAAGTTAGSAGQAANDGAGGAGDNPAAGAGATAGNAGAGAGGASAGAAAGEGGTSAAAGVSGGAGVAGVSDAGASGAAAVGAPGGSGGAPPSAAGSGAAGSAGNAAQSGAGAAAAGMGGAGADRAELILSLVRLLGVIQQREPGADVNDLLAGLMRGDSPNVKQIGQALKLLDHSEACASEALACATICKLLANYCDCISDRMCQKSMLSVCGVAPTSCD